MARCTICDRATREEDPPILAFGVYGNHKVLCDECAADIEEASSSHDLDRIADAMERISKKMGASDPDGHTISTVSGIMASAAARAKLIKEGNYDFSLDEREDNAADLPPELLETEEDREEDEREKVKNEKFDKVYNIVATVLFAALGGYLVYKLIDIFFF